MKIGLLLLLLSLFHLSTICHVIRTINLSKKFVKNSIKGKGWGLNINNIFDKKSDNDNSFYALNRINVTLENTNVIAFIGPSGAGKSTLAKCLIGRELYDDGNIIIDNDYDVIGAYLDHLFCQTYDQNLTINQLFQFLYNKYSKEVEEMSSYRDIMDLIKTLPMNEKVSSLLESQKKIFELIYAILQAEINTIATNKCISKFSYIVVLDEYLDKDATSVRSNIYRTMKLLSHHPKLQLQVIIITHSKAVFNNFCDKVIVLKEGRLYFEGNPKKAFLPNQLQMIE